jgi:thiol reductant ABC exporter CydC subunit
MNRVRDSFRSSIMRNKGVVWLRERFRAFTQRHAIPLRLLGQIRSLWGMMLTAILARFFNLFSGILLVTLAAWGIGQVMQSPVEGRVSHVLVALILLGALKGIAHYLERYSGYYVTLHLLATLRNRLYERLELLAPAGLARTRSGDVVARATTDIDNLETFYAHTIAPTVVAVLIPVAALVAMNWFSGWLTLVFLPFLVIVGAVIPWWFNRRTRPESRHIGAIEANLSAAMTESIQGMREILAFGSEERHRQELADLTRRETNVQERLARQDGQQEAITDFVVALCVVVLLGVGLLLNNLGLFPLEQLAAPLALAIVTFATFRPMLGIERVVQGYHEAMASAARLFELMDRQPLVRETASAPPDTPLQPSIQFEGVYFRYPDGAPTTPAHSNGSSEGEEARESEHESGWVHRDLTFNIAAGRMVALVGSSGVGKTTVTNLLMRFWDVDQGHVRIGGTDIRDLPLADLRDGVAVVAQNTYIFNSTIRENLLIGNPQATDEEIEQAARQANIHEFITSLPQGYATQVGERGSMLSGGQRQRLAIARALLKNTPILVLDEATSNLDAASEREIQSTIQQLMQGRTTIVIAHRLSTIINADDILVMENGQVVEQGNHAVLLARNGAYSRLFASQQDDIDRSGNI